MANNVMEVTTGKVSSFAPNFFNSASMPDFLNRLVLTLDALLYAPYLAGYCVLATMKSTTGVGSTGPIGKCPSPGFTMTVIWPPNSL